MLLTGCPRWCPDGVHLVLLDFDDLNLLAKINLNKVTTLPLHSVATAAHRAVVKVAVEQHG